GRGGLPGRVRHVAVDEATSTAGGVPRGPGVRGLAAAGRWPPPLPLPPHSLLGQGPAPASLLVRGGLPRLRPGARGGRPPRQPPRRAADGQPLPAVPVGAAGAAVPVE